MEKRFLSIWFRYLKTDWFSLRRPELRAVPFVLAVQDHGRMLVSAANALAQKEGIDRGAVVADARAIVHSLQVLDDKPGAEQKLLRAFAGWCIRYTPVVSVDLPDGLILDITGCAHLWGGEKEYARHLVSRLNHLGYQVQVSIADTIGAAYAFARFGAHSSIIKKGQHILALLSLPPLALRLDRETVGLLHKLGLKQVKDFVNMPRPALRRRFGQAFLDRLDQATGRQEEIIEPVIPVEPYQERLPCPEAIVTAIGIEIAVKNLLETLCLRLEKEGKGLRQAILKCYRVDGNVQQVEINTSRPSHNQSHLFKLFELKISSIEPALGIELFILEAKKIEDRLILQEKLWESGAGLEHVALSELVDRIEGRVGAGHIHRYVPAEHYWPERSIKKASSFDEKPATGWRSDKPRPLQLLPVPEPVEVTAPVPDYPPMLFRHKGKLHKVKKADGPERIEQEWWLQEGPHRDYYCVEDEEGKRYWLFRSGHYHSRSYQWFIHGFFA